MKNKNLKILIFLIIVVALLLLMSKNAYATSLGLAANRSSVTVGESFTVNITGSNLTGRVNLSASGAGASIAPSSVWVENGTVTATVRTSSEGTVTVRASGTLADSTTADEQSYSKSCSVKVNAKVEATSTPTPAKTPTTKQPTKKTKTNTPTTKKQETTTTPLVNNEEATPQLGIVSLEIYSVKNEQEKNLLQFDKTFDINILEYTCNVGSDINKIEVIADAKEYNDILKIEGADKELQPGENVITLFLIKDDEEMKYTITIIKEQPVIQENIETNDATKSKKWNEKKVEIPIVWFIIMQIGIVGISVFAGFAGKKLIDIKANRLYNVQRKKK